MNVTRSFSSHQTRNTFVHSVHFTDKIPVKFIPTRCHPCHNLYQSRVRSHGLYWSISTWVSWITEITITSFPGSISLFNMETSLQDVQILKPPKVGLTPLIRATAYGINHLGFLRI